MQPHKGRNTTGPCTCNSSSVTPEIPELLLASTTENTFNALASTPSSVSSRRCRARAARIPGRRRGRIWRGRRGPGRQPRRGRAGSRGEPERASLRCAWHCGSGRRGGCGGCGRSLPEPRGSPAPPGPARPGPRGAPAVRAINSRWRRHPPPPPARRHFVSSSRHLRAPPGRARGPSPAPLASPRARSHPPPLRVPHATSPAAPGRAGRAGPAGAEPAARSCGGALARPSCGLLAACAAACAGRGRPGPGGRQGPARGSYRAGGGRRRSLGAASLSATGPSAAAAAAAAAGRAGGREGREGPSSELSGSGQAPRAGPAVSTSRHCPREPRSRRKGARRHRRLGPSARPPAGAGAAERAGGLCGAGEAAVGAAGRGRRGGARFRGSSCRRLRRGSAALRCPGLGVRPRSAAVPRDPLPARPLHAGRAPPRASRPAARPGPGARTGGSAASPRAWTRVCTAGTTFLGAGTPRWDGRGPRAAGGAASGHPGAGCGCRRESPGPTRTAESSGVRCRTPGPHGEHGRRSAGATGTHVTAESGRWRWWFAFWGLWKIGHNLALKPKACLELFSHPYRKS
ncbi:spidroin-2-like [Agelaius tricolor]|uniref:spidroin-2-like n=1 Tax=Agelaius tricolor TaxID=9191 RepID=UPI0039F1AC9F